MIPNGIGDIFRTTEIGERQSCLKERGRKDKSREELIAMSEVDMENAFVEALDELDEATEEIERRRGNVY